MFGAAWMGFGAGCLPPAKGKAELGMLAGYAAVSALLYGALLNLWFWPFGAGTTTSFSFVPGAGFVHNLHSFILFDVTTSLGFDIPRAVTNGVLVLVLGRPVLAALRRASRRAAFDVPVVID
jgi:energy-coupling factor transport system substrate-specific component